MIIETSWARDVGEESPRKTYDVDTFLALLVRLGRQQESGLEQYVEVGAPVPDVDGDLGPFTSLGVE